MHVESPAAALYVPKGQFVHVPDAANEYLPAKHCTHALTCNPVPVMYVPATHDVQKLCDDIDW